ncbi:MAG: tetratricopeptide repeat protein, partial [Bacteroidota bacterium]|nr:tetratricopeptide repeat protein [Bacteroidota bacterium]
MKTAKWFILLYALSTCGAIAQDAPPWQSYYDSTQLYWARDWNRTVGLLEKAERSALMDLGIYNENYLTILNDLGTAYWKAKNYGRAEKALSRSVALKSEVYPPHDKEVILSMSNLAGFYSEQGHSDKAKVLYGGILAYSPDEVPSDVYINAAQSLVSLYDMDRQPDSALMLLRRIENWNLLPANSFLAFQHQVSRARIHRKLHEYTAAEELLEKAMAGLANRKEPEMLQLYIQCIQERGILHLQTGAYSQAEKELLRAYSLVTRDMNRDLLLTELSNNLAQVYDKLNIYDKALLYYRESLGRCRESQTENSLSCTVLENNIAGIHLKENDIPQAIEDYKKVIAKFEKLIPVTDPLYLTALNNLATAHRKNNELRLALQYLRKALNLLPENGRAKNDLAATLLNNIAVINTAQGDYEQAAKNYEEAYVIRRSIYGDRSILLMDLIGNLAVTYWALDKPAKAIPLFKKSMALATRQVTYVFPNLNESEQVQFYEKLKEDFERFNTIAVQWRDKDGELLSQMFQNRAIIKSLQFFTQLRRKNHIGLKNDAALNGLVSRLKECRDRLGHLYQLPLSQVGDGARVQALEMEVDSLEKAVTLASAEARYGDGLNAEEVHWQSLIPKLQANEAIVEMVRFRKYDRQASDKKGYFGFADSVHYAALILTRETKERPEIVLLRDGNNLETRYFYYYKNAMRYDVEDDMSYHFFWQAIERRLAGKTRIYFSADGVYHRININTLRDTKAKKFLLEKFDIVYLLNPIQFLEHKTPLSRVKRDAVLMGDPVFDVDVNAPRERSVNPHHFAGLPGTEEELRAIDKVLKAHSW